MTAPNIGTLEVQVRASFTQLSRTIQARLDAIARAHQLELRAQIKKASFAKINAQLKSFTGINSLKKSFEQAGEHVSAFFDNLGAIARRVTLLGGALGPLVVGLASLGPALAAIGTAAVGAIAALPGLLAAAGASFFVFKAALEKLPGSIQATMNKFNGLKGIIQSNFWGEATKGVNDFLKSAVQPLKDGFGEIATGAGKFTSGLASAFQKAFTPEVYKSFFGGINEGFKVLTEGKFAGAFADIGAKLLVFGSSIIPQIAKGIEDITVRFDTFLTKNPDFLTNAWGTFVDILKGVFSVVGSVIGIIKGLATAAYDSGIGFANLSNPLQKISDAMNSLAGQQALISFFSQARVGMSGLFEAAKPLGDLLADLGPILGQFIQSAGTTLGDFFGKLFTSLDRPEVLNNISNLLQAFPKIFENIAPSIDLIVDKISGLADVASVVVDELSKTLNSALQAILPAITPLFEPIKKLVATVGDTMRMVFEKIGPVLQDLSPKFASLMKAADGFMKALQSPAAQFIIDLLLGFIKTAVDGFINLAKGVMKVVDGLLSIFSGDFGEGFSKIFSGLGDLIKGAFQLFITFFAPAKIFGLLGRAFSGLATKILPGIVIGLGRLVGALGGIGIRAAGRFLNGILTMITKIPELGGNIVKGLIQGVSAALGGLLVWLTDHILKPVLGFFGIHSPSKVFADIGGNLIQGLIDGIKAIIGFVVDIFKVPLEAIMALFGFYFKAIVFVVSLVWTGLKAGFEFFVGIIKGGLDILGSIFGAVWEGIKIAGAFIWDFLKTAFQVWYDIISGAIGVIGTIIGAVWDGIKVAGEFVWNVLKTAFETWYNIISTAIGIIGTIIGAVWEGIKTAGAFVWEFIKTAFQVWYDIISTAIGIIGAIIGAIWEGIKTAGAAVWDFIKAAFQTWYDIISVAIGILGAIITAIWDGIKAAGAAVWDFILTRWENFKANLSAAIEMLKGVITAVWDAITSAGSAVWDFILSRWENFKNNLSAAINVLKGVFTGAWDAIKSAGSAIWDGIKSAFNSFKDAISNGVSAIKGFFTGIGDSISAPFKAAFGFVARAWNNTVGSLSFTIPDWVPGIGGNKFGIPKIPGYANGVRNAMGGLALVGERGPEIVNLAPGSDVYTASETRNLLAGAGKGGDTFMVTVAVDVNDLEQMKTVGEFVNMLKNARVDARRTAGSGMVAV